MAKKDKVKKRFYWDANVFLSAINANADRLPVIEAILDDCDSGDSEVFTSMLSITEVAFSEAEQESRLLDDQTEDKIDKIWLPPSPVKLIEIHGFVLWDAKDLMRTSIRKGWSLKPADAIHLATAKRVKVDEIHTYDSSLDKYVEILGCTITRPRIDRLQFPT